jgi:plastocyanin
MSHRVTHPFFFAVICSFALIAPRLAAAATIEVTIQNIAFVQADITIHVGDTVHWTNTDALLHTVTAGNPCTPNGMFNSGALATDDDFSFTFNNVGVVNYYCAFHCAGGMTGSITVNEAPTPVQPAVPDATLNQNFPNPFNPTTSIEYVLPVRAQVAIAIYDAQGALVVRMDQGLRDAGTFRAEWNGRDAKGKSVGSGVYFYRLEGIGGAVTRKMVLLT